MAVAPGIDWARATPFLRVGWSSHFLRFTASSPMYAIMAGPPKAVSPSLKKEKKRSLTPGLTDSFRAVVSPSLHRPQTFFIINRCAAILNSNCQGSRNPRRHRHTIYMAGAQPLTRIRGRHP
jgi:hypothetical protein